MKLNIKESSKMKKRYSEYVNYKYSSNDGWFNPRVEWDTELFIDPLLIKNSDIPEFTEAYNKIINYFSSVLTVLGNNNISKNLKKQMVNFPEVREVNLGYSYNSNVGKGLTGEDSIKVLKNLKMFLDLGLFKIEDFEAITIFDNNISVDKMSDMIINILKEEFINYSVRIARENNFETKKFNQRLGYNFDERRWVFKSVEMPYIINDNSEEIPVILTPKSFLVTCLNRNDSSFIDWLYSKHKLDYLKENFDYNLKKELYANKDKILNDIKNNNRKDLVKEYLLDNNGIEYDLNRDPEIINSLDDFALELYYKNKESFRKISNSKLSVRDITRILLNDFKHYIEDLKGYQLVLSKNGELIRETKISKMMHIVFEARIADAGFNIDISPETNSGSGPVDFKISRGDDKVLIENKISRNKKLLQCLNEDKQIHKYLKQEECDEAFLVVFINRESDIDLINELLKKASNIKKYKINVFYIDCASQESASKR